MTKLQSLKTCLQILELLKTPRSPNDLKRLFAFNINYCLQTLHKLQMIQFNISEKTTYGISSDPIDVAKLGRMFGYPSKKENRCKCCKDIKTKRFHSITNQTIIYVDENNEFWENNGCPDCILMFQQNDEDVIELPRFQQNRCCIKCKGKLETSRWFQCLSCRPVLSPASYLDNLIYSGPMYEL